MAIKLFKLSCYVLMVVFLWVVYDTMKFIELPKAQCEANGAKIIKIDGGKPICRYVLK